MPGAVDDFMRRLGGRGVSMMGKESSTMTALRPRIRKIGSSTSPRCRKARPNTLANPDNRFEQLRIGYTQAPPAQQQGC